MKIHKKIKIGIPEIATFSAITLYSAFWGYNEKNMGFHLTPKKNYCFRLSPEG